MGDVAGGEHFLRGHEFKRRGSEIPLEFDYDPVDGVLAPVGLVIEPLLIGTLRSLGTVGPGCHGDEVIRLAQVVDVVPLLFRMFQDQVVQMGMDVGGFSAAEADRMRRAFGRRNGEALVESYRQRFLASTVERGVPASVAEIIFGKFNPHNMFPEGHALAFAFTAYQMGWLRRYHPLEFFVALFNEQPMGFWDLGTLKQDARRLGLRVAIPT